MLNHDAIVQAMLRFNYCQSYFLQNRAKPEWQSLSQEEKMRRAEVYADQQIKWRESHREVA